MPRKKRNTQALGNVLPARGNLGSTLATASNKHDHLELAGAPRGTEPIPNNHGAPMLSPMNWNTGSKPNIRVSLRRPPSGIATASVQEQPQSTPGTYDGSQADVGSSNEDTGTTYDADTDDAFAENRRLAIDNLSWSTTKSDIQDLFQGYSVCNVRLPPKSSGSDLGRATLDLASPGSVPRAIEQLHNKSVHGSNVSLTAAQKTGKDDEDPVSESRDGRMQYQEISRSRDRASGKESTSEEDPNGVAIQLDPSQSNARSAALPQKPRLSEYLEGSREFSFRLNQLEGKPIKEETSCPQDEREVIINILDDSDHESGQITASGESRIDGDYAREDASNNHPDELNHDHTSDMQEGDSGLTDEDAMMEYANSKALNDGSSHLYASSTTRTTLARAQVLADLDQDEFELQLRYFYVGKAREDVALSEPIRCLLCTGTTHVTAQCDQLVEIMSEMSSTTINTFQLIAPAIEIGHEKAQSVIDSITSSYAAEGQAGANPMLNPQGPPPQGFPPPPFGFPGGMPPPPFNMPPNPQGGFPPPPAGRGMPFPPFMPPAGSPANGAPPFPIPGPNGMPNMPFPPPNGMPPPNFAGGFPPPQGGPSPGPPMGGFGGSPPGGRFEGDPRSR
ncbi:MAG: hypothetical protein L6R37_002191 [Teloschistes peruensis]|nr:MAG: hypothetical protein L6R37_002191 [Teloschistes peruensis]